MSNKSSVRKKIGEEKYKRLNSMYPLIEGYLFQKIDELLIIASLSDLKYYIDGYHIFQISIKNLNICIRLSGEQRRIGISLRGSNHRHIVYRIIKEQLNLENSNRHNWSLDYDLKYNYKNCQKLIDIIKVLIFHYDKQDK